MPRIDPQQLLKTLGVLLAPNGGIKSADEVVGIVTLMHKFSKKLVSKCIYVQILKATSPDLLDRFLDENGTLLQNGWDLLNVWFSDAIKSQNWPFCLEMVQLFAYCPITATRLKDNVEHNQAPRLINQLRQESLVDDQLRRLAADVYNKWVLIVSPKKENGSSDISTSDASSDDEKLTPVKLTLKVATPGEVKRESTDTENGPISLLQSLADEVSESIKKEESKSDDLKHHKKTKSEVGHQSHESDKKHQQNGKTDSKSVKDKEKAKDSKDRDDRRKRKDDREKEREKERKRFRPDRRDEVDATEKQRIKEIARRLKAEEDQAKKDKETLSKIGGVGPSSLGKIPKIPKKVVDDKKKSLSFEAMLGGLDSKPKTVKTPLNKNKTASLLEGLTKSSPTTASVAKSSRHESTSSKHGSLKKDHSTSDRHKDSSVTPSRKDSSSLVRRDSFSSSIKKTDPDKKAVSNISDKKPSPLIMPDKKRVAPDGDSPKGKPSPHNYSESTSFMDAIFSSMEPRKKKRRLSDNNEAKKLDSSSPKGKLSGKNDSLDKKEDEEKMEEEPVSAPAFSFYRDTLDTPEEEEKEEVKKVVKMDDEEDDEEEGRNGEKSASETSEKSASEKDDEEDMPFEEPESMPREVKGILVYHRGKAKRNKSITWRAESDLVATRFFVLDEDERVNVNKFKFENMREMEQKMEKAAIKSKGVIEEDRSQIWYTPVPIETEVDSKKEPMVPGQNSTEKDVQFAREKGVLQALYFTREMTPPSPAEPDHEMHVRKEPLVIPLDDQSEEDAETADGDYSEKGWPEPKVNQVDRQATLESTFSLPPALSTLLSNVNNLNILPSMPGQLSQEDRNTFAAQMEAVKAMGILPGIDVAPSFPPPVGMAPPTMVPPPGQGPPPMNGPPDGFQPPPFSMPFGHPNNGPPPGFNGGPPPMGMMPPHMNGFAPDFNVFRNPRGGFVNGRGFPGARGNFRGGFPRERDFAQRDFRRDNDHKIKTKPCMYFASGYCRQGDQCKFIHNEEPLMRA